MRVVAYVRACVRVCLCLCLLCVCACPCARTYLRVPERGVQVLCVVHTRCGTAGLWDYNTSTQRSRLSASIDMFVGVCVLVYLVEQAIEFFHLFNIDTVLKAVSTNLVTQQHDGQRLFSQNRTCQGIADLLRDVVVPRMSELYDVLDQIDDIKYGAFVLTIVMLGVVISTTAIHPSIGILVHTGLILP